MTVLDHWPAVEADFQRYYGLDLRQVCHGARPAGVRRILALVRGLPREAALYRDIDPEAAAWGPAEELLAAAIEQIDYGNRLTFSVHRKQGQKMPEPIRIRRPGAGVDEEPAPTKQATHEQVVRFFGGGR